MFGFFKKNKPKNLLQNWQIPVDAQFERIDNGDSIQYVNDDATLVLYFSILLINEDKLLQGDLLAKMEPSVTRTERGWDLKGARPGNNEVLICLFSFTNESDEVQLKDLFANIVYVSQ
jgi:hypothetical protein